MKKQYVSPATEVVVTDLKYSTCAATGTADPDSMTNEGEEEFTAKSRGRELGGWSDLW